MWITISFVFLAILSILSLLVAVFAAQNVARMTEFPRAELHSLASKMRSIESCQSATESALMDLANRVKMQRVRNATNHVRDREPEENEPTTEKDKLRKRAGLLAGRPAPHMEN